MQSLLDEPAEIGNVLSDSQLDFLTKEYELVSQWAMHGENLSHRVFNFFVSLLTATLGGALVIAQLLALPPRTSLLLIAGACGILMLVGPVFYEALVQEYIRNAYYRSRMRLIRQRLLRFGSNDLDLSEIDGPPSNRSDRLILLDFNLPTGVQQTLISFIDSLLAGALVICLFWGLTSIGFRFMNAFTGGSMVLVVSFAVHRYAAKLMIDRNLKHIGLQ